MTRAGSLLHWFLEQEDDDFSDNEADDLNQKGQKIKDFVKKKKKEAENQGEITNDNPEIIDKDDDELRQSAKIAHHMDRTSGTTKENRIKNYAFPTKRVNRDED